MSTKKIFYDLKDKAQSALNATPLGQYIPGHDSPPSSGGSTSPGPGGNRSYAFNALQHQIRTLQVQYGSGASKDLRQLQLIITGQKGIILDLEKQAQDAQAVSKELYIWGQTENSDVKDVVDRLAYLSFVQGGLDANLAASIDASRSPLKTLRDAEAQLQPRRNIRNNYELQISRLKNENKPGTDGKIRELESLLARAEAQDEPLEKEIELLKRKAIVDSETMRWDAIKEYGEKLVLLAQASKPILSVLPSIPPSPARPYTGGPITAQARAALQKALDTYQPGLTTLDFQQGQLVPETRSFGETHASELTRIGSVADRDSAHQTRERTRFSPPPSPTPPQSQSQIRLPPLQSGSPALARTPSDMAVDALSPSSPVDPLTLNNNPTPLPTSSSTPEQTIGTTSAEPQSTIVAGTIPTHAPTVAETGVPLTAGRDGPGPASGSLVGGRHRASGSSFSTEITGNPFDVRRSSVSGSVSSQPVSPGQPQASQSGFPSAEVEKKRLELEERERAMAFEAEQTGVGPSRAPTVLRPRYETAEEEKKRLEREERERILRGDNNNDEISKTHRGEEDDDGNAPPPYEDPK